MPSALAQNPLCHAHGFGSGAHVVVGVIAGQLAAKPPQSVHAGDPIYVPSQCMQVSAFGHIFVHSGRADAGVGVGLGVVAPVDPDDDPEGRQVHHGTSSEAEDHAWPL